MFYKNNKYLWGNKTICQQEVNIFLIKIRRLRVEQNISFIFILLTVRNKEQMRPRSFIARSNVWDYVIESSIRWNY